MAQYLNTGAGSLALALALALLAAPLAAQAQAADPTRPPDTILAPPAPAAAAGSSGTAAAPMAARPLLQSIIVTSDHAEAIIGGKVVREGDQVALGKVITISESEVTVRTNAGLQTLKLFPGIEKRYAAAQLSAAPAKRNKTHTK